MTDQTELEDQKPEEEKKEQKVDIDELVAKMERLESSNARLLDESKSWKSKYQGIKSQTEQEETKQMQQSEDYKGLYEKVLHKLEEVNGELVDTKKGALKSTLKYEVAKHAKDAVDVDDVIFNLSKNKGSFAYDKEKSMWNGVDEAVGELRKAKPNLFDQSKVGMENGRPNSNVPKDKTLDELIDENPNAVLNKALEQFL